jgi:hypothetical protein
MPKGSLSIFYTSNVHNLKFPTFAPMRMKRWITENVMCSYVNAYNHCYHYTYNTLNKNILNGTQYLNPKDVTHL